MGSFVCALVAAAVCCAPGMTTVVVGADAVAIRVDGDLSDPVWTTAPAVTAFVQREPNEGAPPTHPTDVRVVYDATALYVAVRADEPDVDRLRALLTRRDDNSSSDWIRIFIDSYHDRRTAFEFAVNAAGVKQDRYWFNDTSSDAAWDAVWDVAVTRSPEGWRAEFRIPFSQLRFDPAASGTFGFAVARTVAHLNETSTWPLLARSASGFVSSFGDLSGLVLTGAHKRLELMPYVVGRVTTAPVAADDPLARSPDPAAAGGLDIKYRIGAGLTLTGTVNPDFGQVEADPAVVNLSGFETFFAERRPFFVEGSGNFRFGPDCWGVCTSLFYSRRVGRAPHRSVQAPDAGFATAPANTTILAAAKLTGRVGQFSVGVLSAVTRAEHAQLASGPDLVRSTSPVEPASTYSIVRINREFSNQSRLGFMLTSTNRLLPDALRSLPGSAVTGGTDGDWRFGSGRYALRGHWAGSTVRGDGGAIAALQQNYVHAFARPDAGHVTFDPARTRLGGHAGSLGFSKISGRLLQFTSTASYTTPGFETNDLGYLQRADEVLVSNWLQLLHDVPTTHVRTFRFTASQSTAWNFDRDRRALRGSASVQWDFTNNWTFGSGVTVMARLFDDRFTRGGPGAFVPGSTSGWVALSTDDRRALSGWTHASGYRDWHRSSGWSVSWGVSLRPSMALEAKFGVDVSRNGNHAHWIENLTAGPASHYVFGQLDQTTIGISMRLNYTLSPRLSLQVYGQPFVSTGAYTNFRELVNGRAARFDDRFAPFAYSRQPDFNYHSFRTTNVLRWEYRPGSVLFVVWQQGRDAVTPQGDFGFARDFGRAFTTPGTNVVLVKVSPWFND